MSSRRVAVAVAVFLLLCATAGFTSSTDLVSGGPGGVSDGASGWPSIGNCRELTAFESDATNLVEGDTNGVTDVFASTPCCPVFPGSAGTGRLSVSAAGAEGNGPSRHPAMDALGTSVAYESLASNLVDGDTNDASDIFMTAVGCDDGSGSWEPTTARVSLTAAGEQADGASTYPSVGGNGLIVAFESVATNLVEGDTNGVSDIFVRDRDLGTTLRVSVSSEGGEANGPSHLPVVSADGRFVVFISEATNLVPDDTNGVADVFIRDLESGTTERVSLSTEGIQANAAGLMRPSVSGDGRFVAFVSAATNLVGGDTNAAADVFVRDRESGTTERVSVGEGGAQANGASSAVSIGVDGRFVAFASLASSLIADDTNGVADVFLRDRTMAITIRVSVGNAENPPSPPRESRSGLVPSGAPAPSGYGEQGNGPSSAPSLCMASSGGDWVIAFASEASNFADGDTNSAADIFVRLLDGGNIRDRDTTNGKITFNGIDVPLPNGCGGPEFYFIADLVYEVQAVPDPGYRFTDWQCCWGYIGKSGIVTDPLPATVYWMPSVSCYGIRAGFELIPYTVNIDKTGDGTITVNDVEVELPYSATFYYNDEITITAAAGVGHVFSGWSGSVSGTDNPLQLVIAGDLGIVAHFPLPTVSLTVEGVGSGSVKVNGVTHALPWNGVFDAGAAVTLEAVPAAGQLFVGWSGHVTGDDNPVDFVLLDDAGVTASFGTSVVTLTVNGEPGASLKVNGEPHAFPWSGPFPYGASVTLEAIPGYCSRFDGWSGSVSSMANPLVLAMTGSKTVTASFGSISVFTDIGCGHWAAREIAACADAGIVTGYPDGTYLPEGTVDRAGMAVFIARALAGGDADIPSGPATPTFSDVPADHWAYKYIEYASANHIVVGYGDGTYAPATTVDRGQMAVFIARAIVDPLGDEGLASYTPPATPSFDDVTDSNDWAWCHKYVEYLHDQVIVAGYPDGLYHPESLVTRDQMAVYIARAFDLPL